MSGPRAPRAAGVPMDGSTSSVARAARRSGIEAKFRELYGGQPAGWVRAPGRAELLGTDTDDHLGYVMTMAIHLDTWIAFRPAESGRVRLHSTNIQESLDYKLGEEPAEPKASWDRYVSGVSRVLRLQGHALTGVDAVAGSTVPIGGGLSSSASLLVAVCHMHQAASRFSLDPKQTALACQQAENQDAGVNCGILDHYSACFGLAGTALLLDCRSLTHVEVRIPADIRIVICDTNFPRTLAASGYAQRRQECDEGTRLLRERDPSIRTLRDVNTPLFERLKAVLPEVLRKRCQFVFEENQRVVAFMAAVVRDDREAMRKLCEGSFFGERDLYEKTVPAMERMYEAMTSAPGVVAARQSGGGFGGCMLAYVLASRVPEFAQHVQRQYKEETGIEATIHVTEPSAGAGPLEL
jgi:galactokinase